MCHTVNEDRDWRCRKCGYEFGQPIERVRELLHDQLLNSKIVLGLLLGLDLAVLAGTGVGLYYGHAIFPGLGFAFVVAWTVRAGRKLALTRESLRSLDRQQAALPKATVHSG